MVIMFFKRAFRIKKMSPFKFLCCCFMVFIIYLFNKSTIILNGDDDESIMKYFAIYSTFYFSVSKLYSPNSMIILLNTLKELKTEKLSDFQCLSKNETETITTKLQIRMATTNPGPSCKWEVFIANCSTVLNPTFFGITSSSSSTSSATKNVIEISFENPVPEKYPVVMCFAPMVYESRWQQLIFATEIYHHFGVNMQVQYVNSAMKQIMEILMIYEEKKWLKIEEFSYFDFEKDVIEKMGFHPMKEILSRNQHLGYSDCFMKYREAAEFIIIGDIDEILFPKHTNTYFKEFQRLSNLHPNAATFMYARRYAKIDAPNEFANFSLSRTIESMRIAKAVFLGKSVLRTDFVETPWIHLAGIISKGVPVSVDVEDNVIFHVQIEETKVRAVQNIHLFNGIEKSENLIPFHPIPKNEIASMNKNFNLSFSNMPNFKSNFIYADIIYEYFKNHGNWEEASCITPFVAPFPTNITNFGCIVVRRNFLTQTLKENVTFYVPDSQYVWEENDEKCEIFTR